MIAEIDMRKLPLVSIYHVSLKTLPHKLKSPMLSVVLGALGLVTLVATTKVFWTPVSVN
jgi:hypothetical protein